MNRPHATQQGRHDGRSLVAGTIAVIGFALVSVAALVGPAEAAQRDPVRASFQRMFDHAPSAARPALPDREPADPLVAAMVEPLRQRVAHAEPRLSPQQLHDKGIDALGRGYPAEAYGRFSAAADQGHRGAAALALAMVQLGPVLFGTEWSASAGQLGRWAALASQDLRAQMSALSGSDRVE